MAKVFSFGSTLQIGHNLGNLLMTGTSDDDGEVIEPIVRPQQKQSGNHADHERMKYGENICHNFVIGSPRLQS